MLSGLTLAALVSVILNAAGAAACQGFLLNGSVLCLLDANGHSYRYYVQQLALVVHTGVNIDLKQIIRLLFTVLTRCCSKLVTDARYRVILAMRWKVLPVHSLLGSSVREGEWSVRNVANRR